MASTSSSAVRNLRSRSELFLIGQPCSNIMGTKLPSRRQVLKMYFYGTGNRKMNANDSSYLVTDTVMVFWRQAFIPTRHRGDVKKKVQSLVAEWIALQRNTLRGGEAQKRKEADFVNKLDDLFDIAHANALEMVVNPEDAVFLQMQREKGRKGTIAGVDTIFTNQVKRRSEREEQEEERLKRAKQHNEAATAGKSYYYNFKYIINKHYFQSPIFHLPIRVS